MTDAEVLARAAAVQQNWGGTGVPVLLGHRENAVFRIETATGPIAMRLHRNGYQTHAHIEGEMVWTDALADGGFPCPKPLRTKDGDWVVTLEDGQMVTAISWIEAMPIAQKDRSLEDRKALYYRLGALLSDLHKVTDTLDIPISRPSWDQDALLGDDPIWGRYWENPSLTADEVAQVQTARADATAQLGKVKSLSTGLIHADAIQENVLGSNSLHLIDFDDSGYGFRMYDLAVALIQHENSPELKHLSHAICAGYGTSTDYIPLFLMLRGMASAGWIISRKAADDPAQRLYAERMLRCIKRYTTTSCSA